jgi:hypothetical protein
LIAFSNVWHVAANIPDGLEVSYRFCVCVFVKPDDAEDEKVVVRRWETNIAPRKIGCHGKPRSFKNTYVFWDLLGPLFLPFNTQNNAF